MYGRNIILLLKRLFLLLVMYQIARLVFYFSNFNTFREAGLREFIGGLRFDLSAIFIINGLIILAVVIPGNFKYGKSYQRILKAAFFWINILFLASNFVDAEYYKFISRRSNFTLITASGMRGDMVRLGPVFLRDYWYLFVGFIAYAFLFWKLIPNFPKDASHRDFKGTPSLGKKLIPYFSVLFSAFLIVVAARGGLQRKPIKVVDAIQYTDHSINMPLILNTPFSIVHSMKKKDDLKELSFFTEEEARKIYDPVITLENEGEFDKKNIVLIILESFGHENVFLEFEGRKLTPFLDSLAENSRYFTNAYANGRKSIDAVPSTIISVPYLLDNAYIASPYATNEVEGFPQILKEEGYYTAFFHGAFNGSQNFMQFADLVGFDEYNGKDEYDRTDGEDGVWGIFDEEFLQFMDRKLTSFPEPFFATVFTISSHNPYTIPERYKGKFPKGDRLIHESISYSDYALKKFFETAKTQPWYENTVFIITPDHTSGDDKKGPYYTNAVGNYRIPLLIFDPSEQKINGKDEKLIEQIDVLPEILEYLGYSGKFFSFGNPPDKKEQRVVANYNEGLYHFIIDNYYVCFDGERIIKVNDIKKDSLLQSDLEEFPKPILEKTLKAYIQQYNNQLVNNRTTVERFEESTYHTK